ncbi:TPA: replication protein [Escherichia coli]|jgi:phage replication O-like protein O|uniref:Replication protein n=5 Tax=Escherichia coli TaxID=562 RepID=A0A368J3K8_ECOLX|nr:replication protein [Escherichia coli]EER5660705.1 replication protein [Escherichia coli]EFB5471108.1 replication protein [Escherichia coli]EFE7100387.1 Replication protein O [Escherichia coli]EFE8186238.1 replication protein [Escherichia coli]EFH9530912.1 Replication protein O [Escherichia coli]
MSNLATVTHLRPSQRPVERRVAEVEDGYTRLANALYEELIGADLTKNQSKVAHAICRKTYGYGKKMDRISDSQLAQITRLPRQKVNKAKNELIAMKVILREGQQIGPNKNIEEWQIEGCHYSGDNVTALVTKSVTKTVTALSPKQGHTKETITKEKRKDYSSENSGESSDQPENDLSVVKPDAAIQSGSKWGTAEDLTAAEWMFDMVKTIAPSARKPNFAGWANDIRLMRERDGRNHRDMCVLFRWACQDNFWSGNVLSPAKLRDKWTQLEINRNKQQAGVTASKPKLDLTNTDWIYGVDL